jgi:hypothetical protein
MAAGAVMAADGGTDVGSFLTIGSVLAALASAAAFIRFWTGFSDRIARAETKADNAPQEAAEAKNENDNLREALNDLVERRSREHGDGLSAIRQHVTDLAFFVRDNFVKKEDFTAAMNELKASQARVEGKIDALGTRLPPGHG